MNRAISNHAAGVRRIFLSILALAGPPAIALPGMANASDCNFNGIPDEYDLSPALFFDVPDLLHADEVRRSPLTTGDFDGDGDADILASGYDRLLQFRNAGDGEFPLAPEAYSVAGEPDSMAIADYNDDGQVGISDPISVLSHLFYGRPAPALPGPVGSPCGVDPTVDGLLACNYSGC